ncbi:U6 snRNA-associated Sm-like protein LSm2 isoform 3 [Mus musculus]|uniref:LSM2 homolog, U6 small nuclear RNA and mRNA degradation associated n=1 Tax=Mus musculus TaxID=10090 RepID=G3UZ96_MOUSE|nr:U6 snRNA-associated Sm-like protein LSm2 isoform 3 [Mus musculus]EDL26707.1 LSM2 homolog, U6 small nuclear RNA associated (S. cerevisiae), isoform CRA_e [Mus musculus]|eukprot:NP_001191202.1 U6 snRNA-associated Sm-like protein LSm2 isoform 3 [Mus musculus]
MVFWGKPLASPRESPRAPGENGKRALHFCAVDEDFVRLFYSFFKSLVGKDVVVELKNDLRTHRCCLQASASVEPSTLWTSTSISN